MTDYYAERNSEIRRALMAGVPIKEICERYWLEEATVRNILKGRGQKKKPEHLRKAVQDEQKMRALRRG